MQDEQGICCTEPDNYTMHSASLDREPDTGYAPVDYFECICGSRIGGEDYGSLCTWANLRMAWIAGIGVQAETTNTERKVA